MTYVRTHACTHARTHTRTRMEMLCVCVCVCTHVYYTLNDNFIRYDIRSSTNSFAKIIHSSQQLCYNHIILYQLQSRWRRYNYLFLSSLLFSSYSNLCLPHADVGIHKAVRAIRSVNWGRCLCLFHELISRARTFYKRTLPLWTQFVLKQRASSHNLALRETGRQREEVSLLERSVDLLSFKDGEREQEGGKRVSKKRKSLWRLVSFTENTKCAALSFQSKQIENIKYN